MADKAVEDSLRTSCTEKSSQLQGHCGPSLAGQCQPFARGSQAEDQELFLSIALHHEHKCNHLRDVAEMPGHQTEILAHIQQ